MIKEYKDYYCNYGIELSPVVTPSSAIVETLQFLVGSRLDEVVFEWIEILRPSLLRVVNLQSSQIPASFWNKHWRVTIIVNDADVIQSIVQEIPTRAYLGSDIHARTEAKLKLDGLVETDLVAEASGTPAGADGDFSPTVVPEPVPDRQNAPVD